METSNDNTPKRTEIGSLGEFGLINHLTRDIVIRHSESIKGVGDDAAIINCGNGRVHVITTDLLIEGIHFDLTYHPLRHLGYKAVIVNLSDIYAMNARPKQITVSVGISNRFSVEAMEELYEGIHHACEQYEVDLIGGDTSSSNKGLVISITAIGEGKNEDIIYRNGAQIGDLICITGDLGAAYLGLQILEREKQIFKENPAIKPDLEEERYLIERQLKPEARKDLIDIFQETKVKPTAMIDVSDGLSSDILHICTQSNVGCTLYEDKLPIASESTERALQFNISPVTAALNGGEDYELLFTIPADDESKISRYPGITIIGAITNPRDGYKLIDHNGLAHPLKAQGWQHMGI